MVKSEVVRQVLSELSRERQPIQYGILGGNAGDALIDLGFFDLARTIDLPYEVVDLKAVDPARPLVISGGGGLVDEWGDRGSRPVIEQISRVVPRLIVLPQTVRGNEDLLGSLGEHVVFFAREASSYAHAKEHASGGARILLDHDMAFNLDARALLGGAAATIPRIGSVKDLARFGLYGVAAARGRFHNTIAVKRKDAERSGLRRPLRIYNDLSFVTAFRGRDKSTVENTGRLFLKLIDSYSRIRTDRLHVGIGAFLLGKQVELVNNSNSKIRGIYEQSMTGSDNVRFIDGWASK
ncbi:hypothetical protein ABZ477_08875 [Microbacterium sp. NPDC019599]|uniref:hypothetical protein n=1 Tax=Microbacterium sp. NPDC019599 TaxID=3154690 RepID=UPI0033EA4E73